jgi:L-ascorbate metabolism protein UlaG (beta-lactamase superfamily)
VAAKRRRIFNRRTFVGASLFSGISGAWVMTSPSLVARFLRARYLEIGRKVPAAPHKPDPSKWSDDAVTIAWLGHASVFINFLGVRILIDPSFFPRIGVDAWLGTLGPKRLTSCALAPQELPEIDLVLVSHAHFDHLDIPSLSAVRGNPALLTAAETSELIPQRFYRSVEELRWDGTTSVQSSRGEVRVRALQVRHWGARVRRDTHRGYNGYVLEREGKKLLFGGDTAHTSLFANYRTHGPFEAAIMPIGAYNPWIQSHCTPEQSVAMANVAGAKLFLPIHHQSFQLSNEPIHEPIERVQVALAKEPERLGWKSTGQTVDFKV